MEIQGTIISVLEPQIFNGKNGEFKKFGFILETRGQYPKKIHMQVYGEDKWNNMSVVKGQNAIVSFDVSSREWNGKWFTQCDAWKVISDTNKVQNNQPQSQPNSEAQANTIAEQDILPF